MTDEERQKLMRMMREAGVRYRTSKPVIELLESGADQIERLAQELNEERQKPKLRIRTEEPQPFVIEE